MKISIDISKFFLKSNCCIKNINNITCIGGSLVEPMPKTQAELISPFIQYKDLCQELTITFNLTKLGFSPSCPDLDHVLHNRVKTNIGKYIERYLFPKDIKNQTFHLLLMPEYTSAGVLHFHAIVYISNAVEYYIAKLKRYCQTKFGRTLGKKIYNLDNYVTYIFKDHGNMGMIQPIQISKVINDTSISKK